MPSLLRSGAPHRQDWIKFCDNVAFSRAFFHFSVAVLRSNIFISCAVCVLMLSGTRSSDKIAVLE